MNKIFITTLTIFLSACGGGGSSDNSSSGPSGSTAAIQDSAIATQASADENNSDSSSSGSSESTVATQYSGITTQASVNENNIERFTKVIFGGVDVSGPVLSRSAEADSLKVTNSLNNRVTNIIQRTITAEITTDNKIAQRAVSTTDSCFESGSVTVRGDLNETTLTGSLVAHYNRCVVDGVMINGSVNFEITQYNLIYDAIENVTMSYKDLEVTENNESFLTTGSSNIAIDHEGRVATKTDNIVYISGNEEILLDNYITTETDQGAVTVSGKIYIDNHGYVLVSTQSPVYSTYYGQYYPSSGGPILVSGSNQIVRLVPQTEGSYIQVELPNNDSQVSQIRIGDLSPFEITLAEYGIVYEDVSEVIFRLALSEPLDTTRSSLSDLTLKSASGTLIPSEVSYDVASNMVYVDPSIALEYSTTYTFELNGEWYSVFGKVLEMNTSMTRTTNADYDGPLVVEITPATNSLYIATGSAFVIEFNENIDASAIVADDHFLQIIDEDDYLQSWVPTVASASGNKLTITPINTLAFGVEYKLTLGSAYRSNIRDTHGNNSYFYSDDEWVFKTEAYNQKIDLGFGISYFDIDKTSNTLYGLDQINKKVVIINLTTDTVQATHSLLRRPSRFCIDPASDRMYITTINSSFIEEYRLSDFSQIASIPWSAASDGSDDEHYKIKCTADKLYVVDAQWSPQIYSVNRTSPYAETMLGNIQSTGDLILSNDGGDIYNRDQHGYYNDIQRFQEDPNTEWVKIDESNIQTWNYDSSPISPKLFLDEANDLLINKRYVFNSLNLEQIIYDFGEGMVIAGTDFTNRRVATLNEMFSLDTYNKVMDLPIYKADSLAFDNEGDLYILKNSHSSLYFVKENQMQ